LSKEESSELYSLLIDKYKIDQSLSILQAGSRLIETDCFQILFAAETLIKQNSPPEEIHGESLIWNGAIKSLKEKVENLLNKEFELAICLFYLDGNYFTPYHSDQESSGYNTILPSISLGEVREFSFKNRAYEDIYNLDLANGSLLVMGEYCQSRHTHSLTKNSNYEKGRINITFQNTQISISLKEEQSMYFNSTHELVIGL